MPGQDNTVDHGAMSADPIEGTKGEPVVSGLDPSFEDGFKDRIRRLQQKAAEESEKGITTQFNNGVYAGVNFASSLLSHALASEAPPEAVLASMNRILAAAKEKATTRQLGAMIVGDSDLAQKLVEADIA